MFDGLTLETNMTISKGDVMAKEKDKEALEAIDDPINFYNRPQTEKDLLMGIIFGMTEKEYNTTMVEDHEVTTAGTYRAQLYQQYHYTADNNFMNGGSGGTIIINGDSKTIPDPNPYSGNTLEDDPFYN